jgi:hypothetical protein
MSECCIIGFSGVNPASSSIFEDIGIHHLLSLEVEALIPVPYS